MKKTSSAALKSKSTSQAPANEAADKRAAASPVGLDLLREGFVPVIEFYHLLKTLPFVESVFADRESDGFEVWVVVNQADEHEREQIYEREWTVMGQYKGIGLDVHLIDNEHGTLEEWLSQHHFELSLRVPPAAESERLLAGLAGETLPT